MQIGIYESFVVQQDLDYLNLHYPNPRLCEHDFQF